MAQLTLYYRFTLLLRVVQLLWQLKNFCQLTQHTSISCLCSSPMWMFLLEAPYKVVTQGSIISPHACFVLSSVPLGIVCLMLIIVSLLFNSTSEPVEFRHGLINQLSSHFLSQLPRLHRQGCFHHFFLLLNIGFSLKFSPTFEISVYLCMHMYTYIKVCWKASKDEKSEGAKISWGMLWLENMQLWCHSKLTTDSLYNLSHLSAKWKNNICS